MKKNLLTMLAAIFICGFAMTAMSACSSDNDTPQEQTVTMYYGVKVSDDVLKVADVEVNYVDQTGAKQKEVMTSTEWKKSLNTKALPLTEGIWAKITPKSAVASGNYQLNVTTAAGYQAQLADGKSIYDAFGTDPKKDPTAAQTAEEVAAWCAKSPTVGFTVNKEGYAKQTSVDFGGNDGSDEDSDGSFTCELVLYLIGYIMDGCDYLLDEFEI